jgi:hypothetical protein
MAPRRHAGWVARTMVVVSCATLANIAAAWACVVWSPVHRPRVGTSMTSEQMRAKYGPTESPCYFEWVSRGTGVERVHIDGELWDYRGGVSFLKAGWPFRSLRATWVPPGDPGATGSVPKGWTEASASGPFAVASAHAGGWAEGVPVMGAYRMPVEPIPAGFVRNELVYAAVLGAGLFGTGHARALVRRFTGRCSACGYPVSAAVCPECGKAQARCGGRLAIAGDGRVGPRRSLCLRPGLECAA